ncbi:MAG: DUF2293 domain-containing protein [Candidatus Hydrogenedentes bacterium]|nr:DUF2293 domain-containing protein [Candidatus Hydrogenedentota bacterium]
MSRAKTGDPSEETAKGAAELVVFSIVNPSKCSECGEELDRGSFLRIEKEKPLCMACADLDRLVYLPRGNVALTRRARKYSPLSAVVVRFSRSRGRYERQGVLVEPEALARAEQECLGDEAQRLAARERAAVLREKADAKYVAAFADQIAARYPGCPRGEAETIAEHACEKYSGRVGRSAAAKEFDPAMIDLAVKAHVRHVHTKYDRLLAKGWDRSDARAEVASDVLAVLLRWEGADT